ncbi:hypothetical protein EV401DRAFT_2017694 [Pisolithus croceorrhizus]|nr:hypothetical protein EV401DRAFT_2017694 [Pisolithus croceorrhizus]
MRPRRHVALLQASSYALAVAVRETCVRGSFYFKLKGRCTTIRALQVHEISETTIFVCRLDLKTDERGTIASDPVIRRAKSDMIGVLQFSEVNSPDAEATRTPTRITQVYTYHGLHSASSCHRADGSKPVVDL